MAQVFLVCEGERNSVDLRLLDAVLAQHYGLPILIEPGGGANQPRIVRRWLEQRVTGWPSRAGGPRPPGSAAAGVMPRTPGSKVRNVRGVRGFVRTGRLEKPGRLFGPGQTEAWSGVDEKRIAGGWLSYGCPGCSLTDSPLRFTSYPCVSGYRE